MKRRDFLLNTAGLSSLLFLKGCSSFSQSAQAPLSIIPTNSKFLIGNDLPGKSELIITDQNGASSSIEVGCKPHEIVQSPKQQGLVFFSGKLEKDAYAVDINKHSIVSSFSAPTDEIFYGHSIFSSDGQYIFATMMNYTSQRGFISVRDAKTLKEVRRFFTVGKKPHQLKWAIQDKQITVLDSYEQDSTNKTHSILSFINTSDGKIVKSYKTSSPHHSHFSITNDLQSALVCRVNLFDNLTVFEKIGLTNGEITLPPSIINPHDNITTAKKVEALSHVLIEEKNLMIITITELNKLVFWDYKNNKILHIQNFPQSPRGILMSADKNYFYVSLTSTQSDYASPMHSFINIYKANKFLNFNFTPYTSIPGGSGSHLTII